MPMTPALEPVRAVPQMRILPLILKAQVAPPGTHPPLTVPRRLKARVRIPTEQTQPALPPVHLQALLPARPLHLQAALQKPLRQAV